MQKSNKSRLVVLSVLMLAFFICSCSDSISSPSTVASTISVGSSEVENTNLFAVPNAFFALDSSNTPAMEDIEALCAVYNASVILNDMNTFTFPITPSVKEAQKMNKQQGFPAGQGYYPNLEEDLTVFWAKSYSIHIDADDMATWAANVQQEIIDVLDVLGENPATHHILSNDDFSIATLYTEELFLANAYETADIDRLFHLMLQHQYLTKSTDRYALLHVKGVGSGFIYENLHAEIGASYLLPITEINVPELITAGYKPITVSRSILWIFPSCNLSGMTYEERIYELGLLGVPAEISDEGQNTMYTLYLSSEMVDSLQMELKEWLVDNLDMYCSAYSGQSLSYTMNDELTEITLHFADTDPEVLYGYNDAILRYADAYHIVSGQHRKVTLYGENETGEIFSSWDNGFSE